MPQRRQKGSGGLYQRASDGRWVGTVEAGFTTDGTRRRITVSAKRQSVAARKLREAQQQYAVQGDVPTALLTSTWLTYWLEQIAAPRTRPLTLGSYRTIVDRHLVPRLGKVRLDNLAPHHVREMQRALELDGLAPSYVLKVHRVLAKALTDAMRDGKIVRNVATLVDAPRRTLVVRDSLNGEQAKALLRFMAEDALGSRWAAALLLGARRGELLGLQWDRVDLEVGMVDLAWQLQRIPYRHGCKTPCGKKRPGSCPQRQLDVQRGFEYQQLEGGLCLTRPKSAAGTRRVPLPSAMVAFLELHRREHPAGQHDLVWTREDGRPIDPRDDTKAWSAAVEAAGLPHRVLHSARHTTATLLLESGADVKVIGSILGQSSVVVTRGYQHVSDELARAAITKAAGLAT